MQYRKSFLPIFLVLLVLSGLLFFLSNRHILFGESLFQNALFPVQAGIYKIVHVPQELFQNSALKKLQEENLFLHQQVVNMQKIQQDNVALRDQFETTTIPSSTLLPAEVIGDPQFVPGVTSPESLVLDKGKRDGVSVGDTVVYKTNVVGQIAQVAENAAMVQLVSNKATSFTAKTSSTNAQGVLTGQGNGVMVLGSVVLSDTLKVGDMVVTSGSQDIAGKGFEPGLIVGKIVSVDKNPSSLYQSASVESLLQIQKVTTVFIMK